METTEKIIESYVRYVRRWATIPNVRCDGQLEIDLLAIDPVTHHKYHIESSVSASRGFSRLTAKVFDPGNPKFHAAPARRTLGYKFAAEGVTSRLLEYGFQRRGIPAWGFSGYPVRSDPPGFAATWPSRDGSPPAERQLMAQSGVRCDAQKFGRFRR
jgi:hypothetical protein